MWKSSPRNEWRINLHHSSDIEKNASIWPKIIARERNEWSSWRLMKKYSFEQELNWSKLNSLLRCKYVQSCIIIRKLSPTDTSFFWIHDWFKCSRLLLLAIRRRENSNRFLVDDLTMLWFPEFYIDINTFFTKST